MWPEFWSGPWPNWLFAFSLIAIMTIIIVFFLWLFCPKLPPKNEQDNEPEIEILPESLDYLYNDWSSEFETRIINNCLILVHKQNKPTIDASVMKTAIEMTMREMLEKNKPSD